MIDESKNVQTTPIRTHRKRSSPLVLLLSKIIGRPGTGSLPSTITPPDHPLIFGGEGTIMKPMRTISNHFKNV